MSHGQESLHKALADKLRTDTGAGSLVELTKHNPASAAGFRIARDRPVVKGENPFLGIRVFQSVAVSENGPTHFQKARVYFRCTSEKDLTAMRIADRLDHLLHARAEQLIIGTNRGYYDFSNSEISNSQTRWKSRDEPYFDDKNDVWIVLVEADVFWVDEPCS